MQAFLRSFRSRQTLPWLAATGLCLTMIWVFRVGFLRRPPPQPARMIRLRYAFTLENTTAQPVRGVRFQVAAPVSQTATQQCRGIQCSRKFRLTRDRLGNHTLQFADLDFAPHAIHVICVTASLQIFDVPRRYLPAESAVYLSSDRFISSRHPEIRRLAARLRGRRRSDTAAAIFAWVSGSIRCAGYRGDRCGALFTLQHRRGDCTDQADLFTALCRACRIPARCLAGYICPQSVFLDPRAYHNWAEFFEDGRWRLADPQRGVFRGRPSLYIAMRIAGSAPCRTAGGLSGFRRYAVSSPVIAVRMNLPPGSGTGRAI